MVKKALLVVLTLGLAAAIYFGYRYFETEVTPVSETINAIPSDAAFILETRNLQGMWHKLSQTNIMWEELKTTEYFYKLNEVGNYIDSLFVKNDKLHQLLQNKSVMISAHMSGANNYEFLYCTGVPSQLDETAVNAMIDELTNGKAQTSNRTYDETTIYKVHVTNAQFTFSYALKNGIFITSVSPVLVEDAVRHLNSGVSLAQDRGFMKVQKTAGVKTIDGNLYFNYNSFPKILATHFNKTTNQQALPIEGFSDWTELDIDIKPNALLLNGYTYTNDSVNNYLNVLLGQEPQEIEITEAIPYNAAWVFGVGLSDFKLYFNNYKVHLDRSNLLFDYEKNINTINDRYDCNIYDDLLAWIGNEMAVVITEPANEELANNTFAIFKANNIDNAKSGMMHLVQKIAAADSSQPEMEEFKGLSIFQLNGENLHSTLLGRQFKGLETPYFFFLEDYVVFGNSKSAVRNYISDYQAERTLQQDINFDAFAEQLASETNLFLYNNIARSPQIYQLFLNDEHVADVDKNIDLFRKFEAFAMQFSAEKENKFYNNVLLKYNPVYKQETRSLWETPLLASISSRPWLVTNHYTDAKEVAIQDDSNKVYLISNTGKLLWERQLNQKIMGGITQIDVLNNNKLQMLFNTSSHIYLLDRNGNDVSGFPVALPAPATNAIAAMDYDQNKNYRLLVACADDMVYNYDKTGQRLEGWEYQSTESSVTQPIRHFVLGDKDYILIIDEAGNIQLCDRRGNNRYEVKEKVAGLSNNPVYLEIGKDIHVSKLVYTDTTGSVVKLMFGGAKDTTAVRSVGNHFFDYKDLDGDKAMEYIFVSDNNLSVYGPDKNLVFEHDFDSTITLRPQIFEFGTSSKIGIVSANTNELFLFNALGTLDADMPLYGSTPFSISDINKDGALNLVVGSIDQNIYTYTIKE